MFLAALTAKWEMCLVAPEKAADLLVTSCYRKPQSGVNLLNLHAKKYILVHVMKPWGRFYNPGLPSKNISIIGNSCQDSEILKSLMFRVLQIYHEKKFSWELSLLKIGGIISGGSTAARSPISAASAGNGSRPPAISTTTG